MVIFSACMHTSDLDKPALKWLQRICCILVLLLWLQADQHSGEPHPLLPGLTLLNLHSYEDLMRRFRKPLIPWGIHVVTRHFDLLT